MTADWFPLWNSLRICAISTVFTFFGGIGAAYYVSKLPKGLKGAMDTLLTVPMVLPPTVVGFFILMTAGPRGPIGRMLEQWFGYTLTMKWQASVVAVVIVTFPLMYRTVRGTFEAFDQNLIAAGKTLGLPGRVIFWKVLMPGCREGIVAGAILAFARGLGEYGATSMVSGYIANRTATVATAVAYYWQTNQTREATRWVIVNLAISLAVMSLVNFYEKGLDRKKGGVRRER